MARRRVIVAALLFLTLAGVLLFSPSSPKTPLRIRIAGVTTNNIPARTVVEWETVVPKPANHRAAVLLWSLSHEETNKTSFRYYSVRLSMNESELMSIPLAPNEEGILQWGEGATLKPGSAYRVVGAYWNPNRIEALIERSRRMPVIGPLLPAPKATYATSDWYEVVADTGQFPGAHE